ncbi:HDOD domain-containing protein [Candidatus Magnetomoraceae bacterium gMMP-15]
MSNIPQKVIDVIEKTSPFPRSISRILELTSDIECSPRDLVNVIKHDPVLTIKLLKLVNSPYFGLSRSITTVNQAAVYVGVNTIKNMALSMAAVASLPARNWADFAVKDFWLHSLATASGAKLLAVKIGVSATESEEYFVAGLLHDIGKMVISLFFPKEFFFALKKAMETQTPLYLAEKEFIGASHPEIGALLGKKWMLPEVLVECIKCHHILPKSPSSLLSCVFTADQVSKTLKYGFGGESGRQRMPESIKSVIGMNLAEAVEYLEKLLPDLVKKAEAFINL